MHNAFKIARLSNINAQIANFFNPYTLTSLVRDRKMCLSCRVPWSKYYLANVVS